MTMRRSPRRPLILKRRKLPFQNDLPPAESQSDPNGSAPTGHPKSPVSEIFPEGIRIMDHPSMSDMQVVVIPKTVDLQGVIGALTAKGKDCGDQGPKKFILLSSADNQDNGTFCQPTFEGVSSKTANEQLVKEESMDIHVDPQPVTQIKPFNEELVCGPLERNLTNIHHLGEMSKCGTIHDPAKKATGKENQNVCSQAVQVNTTQMDAESPVKHLKSDRPPYSYMAMIQFAINSTKSKRMTLKQIYTWIQDHFPYFKEVAKPGWKNSIRHNLSVHDMFIREVSSNGKLSYWTIKPEANRFLTIGQVCEPSGSDPLSVPVPVLLLSQQQQKGAVPRTNKITSGRKMKPLLPRTNSYLVPVQLPVLQSSVYQPPPYTQVLPPDAKKKCNTSRRVKKVRIAPKVPQKDESPASVPPCQLEEFKVEVKEELVLVPVSSKEEPMCIKSRRPRGPLKEGSSSRRKQSLAHHLHEEPVLLYTTHTFTDSGLATSVSTFQDMRDAELDETQHSPVRQNSYKTPTKSNSHLASSTPCKSPVRVFPQLCRVTPVGKGSQSVLDFSPIRTPTGPIVTPQCHDYTTFSLSSTPFKDFPFFNSPREVVTSGYSMAAATTDSPSADCLQSSCSRQLDKAGGSMSTNRSLTEGFILDTMNDSLSKVLVDISFSANDDDIGLANISWSEYIPPL
ncbi:forkhead box protein M1 isoform X2 [Thalassophryne amazonica]|uniref:forkhead box protein M1 isoform X2 n=1 Tax=Thalassophryne amazonica TaxID=390379 RepID=UPI001471BF70|nr:forkhead box protein M1 isoform X2 [Thalassophryne amazonica]